MEKTRARDGDGSGWSANTANAYKTAYEYDANGNLLNLARNIYDNGVNDVEMDNLDYNYDVFTGTNKLLSVADQTKILDPANTTDGNHDDITGTHTYTYDEIGNLTSDIDGTLSGISNIEWTIFGKIAKVEHVPGSTLPDLAFTYDAAGNRVKKEQVFPNPDNNITTYYVRDAQGIVMAIYERTFNTQPVTPLAIVKIIEQPIYGSSRLGSYAGNNVVGTVQYVAGTGKAHSPIRYENTTDVLFDRRVAQKRYELTDHLGNIRATITDYVEPNASFTSFAAQVQTVSDYYAFGMQMPGRIYSSESYPFGFGGQEKDDDIGQGMYTAQYWEYDSRIARRWNIDPVYKHNVSNYSVLGNNPILFVDPFGDDWFVNSKGFYIWSELPTVQGFEYAGTELPEGVSRYRILTSQKGSLYHQYMSSPWIVKWNNTFGTKINPLKQYDAAGESFNEELVWNAIGFGALKVGGLGFNALRAAGGSIWKLPVIGVGARGFVYEGMLGLKGLMKSSNFPVIDAFYNGVATSVKTLDFFAPTYAKAGAVNKQLVKYIDDLASFNGRTWGGQTVKGSEITKRVLEVGVPRGASKSVIQQVQEATKYAAEQGIEMNVRVVK